MDASILLSWRPYIIGACVIMIVVLAIMVEVKTRNDTAYEPFYGDIFRKLMGRTRVRWFVMCQVNGECVIEQDVPRKRLPQFVNDLTNDPAVTRITLPEDAARQFTPKFPKVG